MKHKSDNRHLIVTWRAGWILLFVLLVVVAISLLVSQVSVIQAHNEAGDLLIDKQIDRDTTIESRYVHSVARCPMIEKFEVNDENEIVLMESWNCSFGAGIESKTPEGATNRMEDGYFVYDNIEKPLSQLALHAVAINRQTLKIDDQTWDFSEKPFLDETITLYITEESRIAYWWHTLQLR